MSGIIIYDGMDEISKQDLTKIKIKPHPNIKFGTTTTGKTNYFNWLYNKLATPNTKKEENK